MFIVFLQSEKVDEEEEEEEESNGCDDHSLEPINGTTTESLIIPTTTETLESLPDDTTHEDISKTSSASEVENLPKEVNLSSDLFYTGEKNDKNENNKNENAEIQISEDSVEAASAELQESINTSADSDVFIEDTRTEFATSNEEHAESAEKPSGDVIVTSSTTTEISDVTEEESDDADRVFRDVISEVPESALSTDAETETETETEVTSSEMEDEPVPSIQSPSIQSPEGIEIEKFASSTPTRDSTLRHSLRACFADNDNANGEEEEETADTSMGTAVVAVEMAADNDSTVACGDDVEIEATPDSDVDEKHAVADCESSVQSAETSTESAESTESGVSLESTPDDEQASMTTTTTATTDSLGIEIDDSLQLPSPPSPLTMDGSLLDAVMQVSMGTSLIPPTDQGDSQPFDDKGDSLVQPFDDKGDSLPSQPLHGGGDSLDVEINNNSITHAQSDVSNGEVTLVNGNHSDSDVLDGGLETSKVEGEGVGNDSSVIEFI